MSLQDQHLHQALKNAPDRDMVPNDATRAAVLTYANSAVKRRQNTWWKRTSELMHQWFGFNLHSVGLGSAIATVLIVIIFWHEQPDETMWRAAAPSEESKVGDSLKESSVQRALEAASVEKSLDVASPSATVPAHKFSEKIAENKTVDNMASGKESRSKAKSLAPASPTRQDLAVSSDQAVLKSSDLENSGLADSAHQEAAPAAVERELPVAAAPAPAPIAQDKAVVASVPVTIGNARDIASNSTKSELAKELQAESDASFKTRKEDVVAKKSATKSNSLGASAPKIADKPQENQTILTRIKAQGGKALANQDIQVGNLRMLKIEVQSKDLDALDCPQLVDKAMAVDALTGYKVESIASCDATALLLKEVEIYNQTMLDWHSSRSR